MPAGGGMPPPVGGMPPSVGGMPPPVGMPPPANVGAQGGIGGFGSPMPQAGTASPNDSWRNYLAAMAAQPSQLSRQYDLPRSYGMRVRPMGS